MSSSAQPIPRSLTVVPRRARPGVRRDQKGVSLFRSSDNFINIDLLLSGRRFDMNPATSIRGSQPAARRAHGRSSASLRIYACGRGGDQLGGGFAPSPGPNVVNSIALAGVIETIPQLTSPSFRAVARLRIPERDKKEMIRIVEGKPRKEYWATPESQSPRRIQGAAPGLKSAAGFGNSAT